MSRTCSQRGRHGGIAKSPGLIVVGAVHGASCFGPAYEFAIILDTELKRRRIRDRVPITFVTSEPYIGHLGLDGVGDTSGLPESEMRDRHIKWITNARVSKVEQGRLFAEELNEDGSVKTSHELPFAFSMMLPAFRGVSAIMGVEGLVNSRGFVIVDKRQRNPTYPNVFGIGVAVAIAPTGKTPVPVGVPKTGFMIESMVTATAKNIGALLRGREAAEQATWNAVCLADFGDGGVAFVAQPQIPPRNVSWAAEGKWQGNDAVSGTPRQTDVAGVELFDLARSSPRRSRQCPFHVACDAESAVGANAPSASVSSA